MVSFNAETKAPEPAPQVWQSRVWVGWMRGSVPHRNVVTPYTWYQDLSLQASLSCPSLSLLLLSIWNYHVTISCQRTSSDRAAHAVRSRIPSNLEVRSL